MQSLDVIETHMGNLENEIKIEIKIEAQTLIPANNVCQNVAVFAHEMEKSYVQSSGMNEK